MVLPYERHPKGVIGCRNYSRHGIYANAETECARPCWKAC